MIDCDVLVKIILQFNKPYWNLFFNSMNIIEINFQLNMYH